VKWGVYSARSPPKGVPRTYGLHTTKEKVGGARPDMELRGCFWGLSSLIKLDYTAFLISIKKICNESLFFN
jgi:hypothetical protein